MAGWKYNLGKRGSKLRELTDGNASKDNCETILNQITLCCKTLLDWLTDDDKDEWEYELEDMIEECDDTKSYLDDYDEESNEENINDILDRFYDLMDYMRVWIGF